MDLEDAYITSCNAAPAAEKDDTAPFGNEPVGRADSVAEMRQVGADVSASLDEVSGDIAVYQQLSPTPVLDFGTAEKTAAVAEP